MSTNPQCEPEFAPADARELRLLMLLPYAMLLLATGLAVANDWSSSTEVLEDLCLAGATGLWMGLLYALRSRWQRRPTVMGPCFVVLLALMAALVLRDPLFGFVTWTGYIWAGLLFTQQWRLLAFAPVALITATSQHGGLPTRSATSWIGWIAFFAINLLAASAINRFANIRQQEHARRKQMLDELTETNAKLQASLDENAGLRAQLLTQAREAGATDERQRMAGEIHDTLAQGLVGIITQLEAASQALADQGEWRRRTDTAIELARESLAEARRSVQALAPMPLARGRLLDALETVAAKWSERSHVATSVRSTGKPRRLPEQIELALLRTAQEALANVAKHANAGRVVLTLSYMTQLVTLDVRDDGAGFDVKAPATRDGGFGLTAMRQRVEGLAGTLEIESSSGAGTTVAASIPVATDPIPVGAESTRSRV
jgi:signal transduction histidine kinase